MLIASISGRASPRRCPPKARRTRASPEQPLARLHRLSAVATPYRDERPAAGPKFWHGREVHERDRRGHLVGERIDPPVIELQHLRCPLQRVEEVPAVDGRQGWRANSREVTIPKLPPPPLRPQKRSAFSKALTLSNSPSAVTTSASRTLSALKPYLRPSQRNPRPWCSRPRPPRRRSPPAPQARKLQPHHAAPQRTWLHPSGLGCWIDPHAPHARGVDQDTPITGEATP